jgi:alkylation response protein AidB-like acyl-CoA dehydrogenase
MIPYTAPLRDMQFLLEELIGLDQVSGLPGYDDVSDDLVRAVLAEAGKFGSEVLAPLNRGGDTEGARLENGAVTTAPGFADAYKSFVDGGWNGLVCDTEFGGQGLPWLVATPVSEIWDSANLAFSLCPMLTLSAIELLTIHGTDEQRATYLEKLVSGEWTGTMNLTEPQAGTDIGAIRCRAVKDGDHYRLAGQKIFITWGEHDVADNIIHMVLARVQGAPGGVKGLSLFIVPKFLVNADGAPGRRNDLRCVSLEHKLGIHGSPTAVMSYGDDDGAVGYLVGEEGRGIEYMFTMMNNARLAVGLEGVAIAERAYQQARDYAANRIQGRAADGTPATLDRHLDVRRMLMTMKCRIEAMRALAYSVAASSDIARRHPDAKIRASQHARLDLLVPVVKAWSTDQGVEIASMGVQVHGGAGFIEETGAAQHYRDARITSIYEGANGIQALDLVGRKMLGDRGAAAGELFDEMRAFVRSSNEGSGDGALDEAIGSLQRATDWIVANGMPSAAAGATPYLELFGIVVGGYLMARSASIAEARLADANGEASFYRAKIATARFYAGNILPRAGGLERAATSGSEALMAMTEDAL